MSEQCADCIYRQRVQVCFDNWKDKCIAEPKADGEGNCATYECDGNEPWR